MERNRIEWLVWSPESFAKAEAENKALFVFVSHSGCVWCDKMEEESFVDEEIGGLLQRDFIPIRVDSYARPDIDRHFHALFTQMTGREANNPLCLFLSPEKIPLYAATYMPPHDRDGMMGLRETLELVGKKYQTQRVLLLDKGEEVLKAMPKRKDTIQATELNTSVISLVSEQIQMHYDSEHGGFGESPKFLRHSVLELLMDILERKKDTALEKILRKTLDAMTTKGVWDASNGGFYHYCTDAAWEKPAPVKLLYDNALMVQVLLRASTLLGEEHYHICALQTTAFIQSAFMKNGCFVSLCDKGGVRDGRTIVSWSAMAIKSLFLAGEKEGSYRQLAIEALDTLLEYGMQKGQLYHSFLPQVFPAVEAFLEDYAYLTETLLLAQEITGEEHYLVKASALINTALKRFFHAGLWHYSEGEMMLEDEPKDAAYPAALAVMTAVLHKAAACIDPAYEKFALRTLEVYSYALMREPITMPQLSRALLATV